MNDLSKLKEIELKRCKEAYKVLTQDEMLAHVRNDAFTRDWKNMNVAYLKSDKGDIISVLTFKTYVRANNRSYGKTGDIQLKQIAVHKDNRRKGIGEYMIYGLIEYCKTHNVPNIVLAVRKDNVPARKLYEKIGFKELKKISWNKQGTELPGIIYGYKI